ncbi:hypothetical protein AVEN_34492-1 [Araneus ventricosus]|uniref:Uncharacterized protein n=1 Tax=Araneus ventricosus TaxID=182803 RepID=A0A4Y2Q7V8_ARAVE|nr:hypothetical protein AVEN_34492-1 [Araneus ventricosus]
MISVKYPKILKILNLLCTGQLILETKKKKKRKDRQFSSFFSFCLSRPFSALPYRNLWNSDGESNRQGQKPMKFGANDLELRNPLIPIWDLDARLEAHQWICLHWNLALRIEVKLEISRVGKGSVDG